MTNDPDLERRFKRLEDKVDQIETRTDGLESAAREIGKRLEGIQRDLRFTFLGYFVTIAWMAYLAIK